MKFKQNTNEESGALALEIANVGGVFLVLILGCVLAIFVNWIEFIHDIKQKAVDLKV